MKKFILPLLVSLFIFGCSNDEIEEKTVTYELTIIDSEGGSVSIESGTFEEGSEVTLSVIKDDCYEFSGWEGIDSNEEIIVINIDSNLTIKPIFNKIGEYFLKINNTGEGKIYEVKGEKFLGKYTTNVEYIEFTGRCFSEGEEIFIFAKPDDEYQFYGWKTSGMSNVPEGHIYDMNGGRVFKLGLDFGGDKTINLTANFVKHHFWEDPMYSSLNMDSTPEDIVNVFLEEASQYGWDFKEKVENIIINTTPPDGYNSQFGWGAGSMAACIENTYIEINIPIHEGPDSFTQWDFSSRMSVIYHELGHDLMNMNHICLPAHHMSGWDSCNGSDLNSGVIGDLTPMYYNGIIRFGGADLLMETDEEVLSWKRATKDLFELKNQDVWCDIE
jgi:hypothetical protein